MDKKTVKTHMRPIALVAMLAFAASFAACDDNDHNADPQKFSAALYGDVPYGIASTDPALPAGSDPTEFKKMPAYLANINADEDLSVVVHVGDLHSGSEPCTEAYDKAIAGFFKTLTLPLVYTPGDNEWQDCQVKKELNGTYSESLPELGNTAGETQDSHADGNPVGNLALIRELFFSAPGKTLGSGTLSVHSQATEGKTDSDKKFVENVWWMNEGVLFVSANVPGGSNNGTDLWFSNTKPATPQWDLLTDEQKTEIENRSAATRNWLSNAFDQADDHKASAVVILAQADMWSSELLPHDSRLSEYKQYIDIIATRAKQFGKPVLLINGDTHVFQSDNPLKAGQPCVRQDPTAAANTKADTVDCGEFDPYSRNAEGTTYDVPNFRRIMVHGQTLPMEWTKLTFDPSKNADNGVSAFGPFSWERQFVQFVD